MEKRIFTITIPEGAHPGDEIRVVLNNDNIKESQIDSNGKNKIQDFIEKMKNESNHFLKNSKLFRRWVMANYMKMMYSNNGYAYALNNWYPYHYQFKVVLDELTVLAKLEKMGEVDTLEERSKFFGTNDFMHEFMHKYKEQLSTYWNNCKKSKRLYTSSGIELKTWSDIDNTIGESIRKLERHDETICYTHLLNNYKMFMKNYVDLPAETKKIHIWKEAYQRAGAYYSLKNLIMFHDCRIKIDGIHFAAIEGRSVGDFMTLDQSISTLTDCLTAEEYSAYNMHALLRKVMEDNQYDFKKAMRKKYN